MSGSDSGGHGLGVLMAIIFLAGEMAGVGVLALPKVGNKISIRLLTERSFVTVRRTLTFTIYFNSVLLDFVDNN